MALALDLTGLARDLLRLQVNTIVRDNMTAEPMPAVPHALLDIAGDYANTLCALGINLPRYFESEPGDPSTVVPGWLAVAGSVSDRLTVSSDTFDRLRWAAKWANASRDAEATRIAPERRVLLDRIVNNSDAIKEMFKSFGAGMDRFVGKTRAQLIAMTIEPGSYEIPADAVILLQKIWDIGVEQIVAQTVVYVSGDITTRVQEALRNPGSEALFAIHRQSIDVSVACWRYLLDAVREIAGTAIRDLLGRRT